MYLLDEFGKVVITTLVASTNTVHLSWKTPKDEAGRELKISIEILIDDKLLEKEIIPLHRTNYDLPGLKIHSVVDFYLRPISAYGDEGSVTHGDIMTDFGKLLLTLEIIKVFIYIYCVTIKPVSRGNYRYLAKEVTSPQQPGVIVTTVTSIFWCMMRGWIKR